MNGLTFMQLCHAISLTLFVHSFFADTSLQSSLIPISFMANDYRNNSWNQLSITGHWINVTDCPLECTCAYALSTFSGEYLRTVHCINTTLDAIPNGVPIDTEALVVTDNTFDSLPLESFTSLDHLLELNLTDNRLKHLVRGHIFNNLSHLKVLDLSRNRFRQLFAGVFRGLRRLLELRLANGVIKYMDEHSFDGLEMLSHLDLSNNQISSIYLELFQSISNLKSLNLDHNHISHLTGGIFTSMTTLRKLHLAQNKIISINDNAFVGLDQLEELYLQDNSLLRVPNIALQSLKRIAIIRMDGNPFAQLSTGDFVHLPANIISLANCTHLSLIDRGAFWDLPNLYTLILADNPQLAYIDAQAFVGLPLLHTIELHDCGLQTIQYDIINNIVNNGQSGTVGAVKPEQHFMKRSIKVSLGGNPFVCDCNVKYLYQCLIDQHNCSLQTPNTDQIVCAEPPVLNGTHINQLNISAIADECRPQLVSEANEPNVTVHKKIGDKHQFQCRALGIPVPKIHWILPNGDVLNETSNTIHYQLRVTGSLRLFHLKPRDSGVYQCVAENSLGADMSAMTLMVDNIDLHLYPLTVTSNYITLVWNGTERNSFHEYQLIYKPIEDDDHGNNYGNGSRMAESQSKSHSKYELVKVNHLLRSYSLTHLESNTKYRICLTVRDADARNGYVQLSCAMVQTRPADNTTVRPIPESTGSTTLALSVSAAILILFGIYLAYFSYKRYRFQRQYEIPAEKLATNPVHNNSDQCLAPIPLENIYSPLIKHMRH